MREPLRRALVLGWVLLVVVMALVVIWQVMWGGPPEARPDRAQVWGTLWAAIVIVPPMVGWGWQRRHRTVAAASTRAEVEAAADKLAEQTLETWSRQVVQRGIQAPAPVRVRWRWATDEVALPREELAAAPSLVTDPSPLPSSGDDPSRAGQVLNSGLVTRLHDEVYARLHHGRLVLIGGPGAGKTGAMILLLLEALRYRQRRLDEARIGVPVPVWLTLGSWDPMVQGLRDWVIATISRDHPYLRATDFGPDVIAQLFDTGRIALFLDGLDEMPDTPRSKAVERLTTEAAGRRTVITSRPDEFRETIELGRRQLPYAAVIELRPVAPKAAAAYLLEGQIGAMRQAWQPVADHLLSYPNGVLAQTLNTPLTLSLARAAYTADDPRRLLTGELANEHGLRVHLLDQVLDAAYTDPRERARATYWLGWLAHKMRRQPNGPIRELRWWQIASWIPRWQIGLIGGLISGLFLVGVWPAMLLLALKYGEMPGREGVTIGEGILRAALIWGLFGALVVGLMSGLGVKAIAPRSITIRWPKRQDVRSMSLIVVVVGLAIGLFFGLTSGLFAGVDEGLATGVSQGLFTVVSFGLIFGLLFGVPVGLINVWRIPLAAGLDVTPRLVYQRDLQSHILGGLVSGLVTLIGFGLLFGVLGAWVAWTLGLALGLTFGLLGGLVSGYRVGAAPSLLFTELALWSRGRKVRFMPLLESALDRQVLRQAGAVYQFRHADLQDRLAERYEAGLVGAKHSDTNLHSLLDLHDH